VNSRAARHELRRQHAAARRHVRGQVPLALFLLDHGADRTSLMPVYSASLAAGTWENGLANPVYGFVDPIGGNSES